MESTDTMATPEAQTTGLSPSASLPGYALIRRCEVCGKINAIDLDGTPKHEAELRLPDHTVMRLSEAEAMKHWKNAGRCDHKALIEALRAEREAHNDKLRRGHE